MLSYHFRFPSNFFSFAGTRSFTDVRCSGERELQFMFVAPNSSLLSTPTSISFTNPMKMDATLPLVVDIGCDAFSHLNLPPYRASCKPHASAADNASMPQMQLRQSRPESSELNSNTGNQEMAVEGGTISISSMYSQGLLNTLTHALKSSGVNVSQANISVQVDIGKQTNPEQNSHKTSKDFDINCDNMDIEESNHNAKRLKMMRKKVTQ